jgi:Cu/Ag efflux protein CusF
LKRGHFSLDIRQAVTIMVFTVKYPVLLDVAKPGDKVRFGVAREDGKFVVTAIEPAP